MKNRTIVELGLEDKAKTSVLDLVTENFGEYRMINESSTDLKFQVPRKVRGTKINFGDLFKFAEIIKDEGLILDYSICETTFEHVFQYFVKKNSLQAEEEALASIT